MATHLKPEYSWGTGQGRVHIMPTGKANGNGMSLCSIKAVRWDAVAKESVEQIDATDFGMCSHCGHHLETCVQ